MLSHRLWRQRIDSLEKPLYCSGVTGSRIRIGRANQRHYEPEKLPGPNRFRARAIHARAEELSEESALDRVGRKGRND